jgi:molybdate transport system substrate-binding protein
MFFSANLEYARQLQTAGLTESGTYYPYARGRIVVWVPTTSKLDLGSGLQALLNPSIEKIAIANPHHAPYGQAALAAMKKEEVYEKIKDKLVFGENISQTASFVVSGSADVGIIALSLALAPNMRDKGRYAEIPIGDYPPLEQACVIMKSSLRKDVARAFLNFVKTRAAVDLLRNSGFTVPDNRTATER